MAKSLTRREPIVDDDACGLKLRQKERQSERGRERENPRTSMFYHGMKVVNLKKEKRAADGTIVRCFWRVAVLKSVI